MAGLLQKDFYLIWKYCKAYLLIAVVFLAASLYSNNNLFFLFYPCVLAGMIPITLMSYDERSHWMQFADTLPFSRAQIVSAKYLIGLIAQVIMILLVGIFQAVRLHGMGAIPWGDFAQMIGVLAAMSAVAPSIYLPIMFKWGTEKARIFYYIIIGFTFAVIAAASVMTNAIQTPSMEKNILWVLCPVVAMIYALSWLLSIAFYQKREIQ